MEQYKKVKSEKGKVKSGGEPSAHSEQHHSFTFCVLTFAFSLFLIFSTHTVLAEKVMDETQYFDPGQKLYPMSIEDATQLALINNFDIQLAKYDVQISQTGIDSAESVYDLLLKAGVGYTNDQRARTTVFSGSKSLENTYTAGVSQKTPFGTTIDLDYGNTRTWSNSTFATLNPAHDSDIRLTWKQDLGKNILGIQDRGNIKLTKIDVENTEYTSLEKIELFLADVQKAYWEHTLSLETVEIEERMVEQAKKLFDLHQEKIQDGLIEEPELFASEANYRTRVNRLMIAEDQAETKENMLKLLLNVSDDAVRISPADRFRLNGEPQEQDISLQEAFENRRDYKRAENTLKAKDIDLVMKKNSLWPEIDLEISFARNGVGSHAGDAFNDISSEDNPELFTGVSVTFPLQNRKARAQLKSTELEKAQAILKMKYLERKIAVDIMDQVRSCNVLREAAINEERIAELQKRKLKEEEKRFKYGRSSTDTIIRFQEDVIDSELSAMEAKYRLYSALIDLKVKENSLLTHYWEEKL